MKLFSWAKTRWKTRKSRSTLKAASPTIQPVDVASPAILTVSPTASPEPRPTVNKSESGDQQQDDDDGSPLQEAAPAPPITEAEQALAANADIPTTPRPLSEQLWDEAYDGVKADESSLVEAYEMIISRELCHGSRDNNRNQEDETAGEITNVIAQSNPVKRREQMAQLIRRRQSRSEGRQTVVKAARVGFEILEKCKETIAGALEAYPPAGLAFAGACLLAEVPSPLSSMPSF